VARLEDLSVQSAKDLVPMVFPAEPRFPAGYDQVAGGMRIAHYEDGSVGIAEGGAEFSNGRGFPIRVGRWIPPAFATGAAYGIPVPRDGPIQVTLGDLNGRPAIFKHRRAGVSTPELQEVYFAVGNTLVAVESYLDNFNTLVEVAESISAAFKEVGQ
jgi:hypothetical protein